MTENDQNNDENMVPEDSQGLISDFLTFLKEEKIWWVLPLIIILGLFAMVAIFGANAGPLAPFIYPFM